MSPSNRHEENACRTKLIMSKAISLLLFLALICGQMPLIESAFASETRLKRPTYLYGSAQKKGKYSGNASLETSKPGLLEGKGQIDQLFPTKKSPFPLEAQKENSIVRPLTGKLSESELNILSKRDLLILVDKSYSMKTRDCPPVIGAILVQDRAPGLMHDLFGDHKSISRWQWVAAHALDLSNQIAPVKPEGFKLIFFNQWRQIFEKVSPAQVPKIFYNTKVGGDTLLAQFLGEQLLQYVAQKKASPSTTKPLAVAVVTDGLPDDKNNLSEIIIHVSKQLSSPNDLSITFLQVGRSSKGEKFLADLDNKLVGAGAKYDLVDHKTFSQVKLSGLGRAIVDSILEK